MVFLSLLMGFLVQRTAAGIAVSPVEICVCIPMCVCLYVCKGKKCNSKLNANISYTFPSLIPQGNFFFNLCPFCYYIYIHR